MEKAANDLIMDVTTNLAEKFDFDVERALSILGVDSKTSSKKKPSLKPKQYNKKPKESVLFILPWCGEIMPNCCQAIKSCNKLYVQCRNDKLDGGDFCRRCQTETTKNKGIPPYGVIQERLEKDYTGKDGKKPINYGNYMKTRPEITRERALEEAEKLGWTIPEEQFQEIKNKKGRKPKPKKTNVMTSDTDEEDKTEDLFAKKAAEMDNTFTSDESSDEEETLGNITRKQNSTQKVEKKTESKSETVSETVSENTNTIIDIQDEITKELEEESMSESDCESDNDELEVELFTHKEKEYHIDVNDNIYDIETHKLVGKYDRNSDNITTIE